MAETTASGSRLFTVRLPADVRDRLDVLASTSDRTLAQLARYALTYYFASPAARMVHSLLDGTGTKHTSLRLPADLATQVDVFAGKHDVTTSDVIRHALTSWLDAADASTLGNPSTVIGGAR